MKRRILALLLAALTMLALSTAALADGAENGVYNVKNTSGYTLTPTNGTADGSFYKGADAFTLTCPAGTSGEQTLVLLLEGTDGVPTEENLQYIDQQAAGTGKVSFTLKPRALTAGSSYSVWVSTTGAAAKQAASFQYGEKPAYKPGDANGDGEVSVDDAAAILNYLVEKYQFKSDNDRLAADVEAPKGEIDVSDAARILNYLVGKAELN